MLAVVATTGSWIRGDVIGKFQYLASQIAGVTLDVPAKLK
jgi:hypothetical protein